MTEYTLVHKHTLTYIVPLKTLAYTHQTWAARTFSDHPSAPQSLPLIHTTAEGVCVIGTVCQGSHKVLWHLPAVFTRLCDLSCPPAIPLSLPYLYLWINASHPIMSKQPHTACVPHLPPFPLSTKIKPAAVCWYIGYVGHCMMYCMICVHLTHEAISIHVRPFF